MDRAISFIKWSLWFTVSTSRRWKTDGLNIKPTSR